MNKLLKFIFLLLSFVFLCPYTQGQIIKNTYVISDTIHSKILGEDRRIMVYLPPGYYETNDSYPLQIVFGDESRVNLYYTLADYLSKGYSSSEGKLNTIPESIIVGIGRARGSEEQFKSFFTREVIPFIENKYRKCHYKVLVGHSFEAGFVLKLLFDKNSPFNAYFCSAPTEAELFIMKLRNNETARQIKSSNKKLFISCSVEDGIIHYPAIKVLIDELSDIPGTGFSFGYVIKEHDSHHSIFPSSSSDALQFLFSGWSFHYPEAQSEYALDAFIKHYKKLSKATGMDITPPESEFYTLAYLLNARKQYEQEILVYLSCKEYYPEAVMADALLSRIYYKLGDMQNARIYNEKALRLNPDNQHAMQTKKWIEEE